MALNKKINTFIFVVLLSFINVLWSGFTPGDTECGLTDSDSEIDLDFSPFQSKHEKYIQKQSKITQKVLDDIFGKD